MDENLQLVDINRAGVEELCRLPGVGTSLAERIIAARPFNSAQDLIRVRGISLRQVDKLLPFITAIEELAPASAAEVSMDDRPVSTPVEVEEVLPEVTDEKALPVSEELPVNEPLEENRLSDEKPLLEPQEGAQSAPVVIDMTTAEPTPAVATEEQVPEPLKENEPKGFSRTAVLVGGAIVAFFTLVLAVMLSLALLWSINGSLHFVSSTRYVQLTQQVNLLDTRINQIQQDTTALQERMDALEGLSARIGSVEKENADLKQQIVQQQQEVNQLNNSMQTLEAEMTEMQQQNSRFERFFDGLKTLMGDIFSDTK